MIKNKSIYLVFILALSGLCCSCKSGWPAVPHRATTRAFVKAQRINENGDEVARVEVRTKSRTWQFLFSPEGPVKHNYHVSRQTYIVDERGEKQLEFLSECKYAKYVPVLGEESWVGIKFGALWERDYADAEVCKFNKQGVMKHVVIPDCRIELSDIGRYEPIWEHEGNQLRFETKSGRVFFDLKAGVTH